MERTIYMLIAYDGTEFHGWQTQPGYRTVQNVLEETLRRCLRHPMNLIGCGRTDSGVHALGHVCSFVTTCTLETGKLKYSIGARLPDDLSVIDVRHVHNRFNARRCALSKLYRYRIFNATHRPVERLAQRYTYHYWQKLDIDAMREAARHFIGKMDFTSMASAKQTRESMVREVLRCDVERHHEEIRIDVEGTGFLYRQVRNMVGTLIDIGRGRWQPDELVDILAACDRSRGGGTAPAKGLSLVWLRYPPEMLVPPQTPVMNT